MKHLEGMSNQLTSHHALWMNTISIFVEKARIFYCSLCYCLHVNAWQSIKITCFAHFITLIKA